MPAPGLLWGLLCNPDSLKERAKLGERKSTAKPMSRKDYSNESAETGTE